MKGMNMNMNPMYRAPIGGGSALICQLCMIQSILTDQMTPDLFTSTTENGPCGFHDHTINSTRITVIPNPASTTDDAMIRFNGDSRDNAWLTIDLGPQRPLYSLNIIDTGDGIQTSLFFTGHEEEDTMTTTASLSDDEQPASDQEAS